MSSGIQVRISRSALVGNARAAASDAIVDLRRDAWGHGVALVAPVLVEAGLRAVHVDDAGRDDAIAAGLTVTDAAPTADGPHLFGLPAAPVMRASSRVVSLKTLRAGEGVSYGYTHRAAADTTIALVAGGYAQGVVRALGNRATVEIGGVLRPIVGRVAMDVCVVDVADTDVAPGDEVVFFGGEGPARDALTGWAATTGLRAAELVCAIGLHATREVSR